MWKIDDHMHVSLEKTGKIINGAELICAAEMLELMEKNRTARGILMSSGEEGCLMCNEELYTICQRYPERFSYMAMFDVARQQGLRERVRREKERGAVGVGEFTTVLPFDDPRLLSLLEILEEEELPLLFHMSPALGAEYYGVYDEAGLPRLEKVLKRFPGLTIIAHSQPFWYEMTPHGASTPQERNVYPAGPIRQEGRVQELLRGYPNLHADLSANSAGNAVMRDPEYGPRFLEEFSEQLIFGTDLCCKDQQFPLGAYLDQLHLEGRLSERAYKGIFRENALRCFRLPGREEGK